jgi:hypothetical protein
MNSAGKFDSWSAHRNYVKHRDQGQLRERVGLFYYTPIIYKYLQLVLKVVAFI